MSPHFGRLLTGLAILWLAIGTAACGKAEETGGEQGGIKTGPGVTTDDITLGLLADLTGPFGPQGKASTQGSQVFWGQQNKAGGVCERQVKLTVKDHGADPQRGVTLYREVTPDVLALQQVVTSAVNAAVLPLAQRDDMLVGLAAWPPAQLPKPQVQLVGTTYDVETINGIDYLMREAGLKEGDTIGHVYVEGEFGEGALLGSKFAAQQKRLKLVTQKIKPTDADMSAQVSAFQRARVKAILASIPSKQMASLAGVAKARGLNVKIAANAPAFVPQLLAGQAASALEENVVVLSSIAPFSLDKPKVQDAVSAFRAKYPKEAETITMLHGYALAEITYRTLKKACESKDLTRAGVVKALHTLSDVDTGGITAGPQSYTQVGEGPSRFTYISRVDRSAPGGLTALGEPFESQLAKDYEYPKE